MLEINEGAFPPQGSAQLLPVYDLSLRLQEQAKHLERLFLNGYTKTGLPQFTTAQIDTKSIELGTRPRGIGSCHTVLRFFV
jgi:hypothetical protein